MSVNHHCVPRPLYEASAHSSDFEESIRPKGSV